MRLSWKTGLIECFKILFHSWHQHAGVNMEGCGSSGRLWRGFGRIPKGGPATLPKFMCVWRLSLGFCWYSLMILLWAFKCSSSAVGWLVVPKKKCSHPNAQNMSILPNMAKKKKKKKIKSRNLRGEAYLGLPGLVLKAITCILITDKQKESCDLRRWGNVTIEWCGHKPRIPGSTRSWKK